MIQPFFMFVFIFVTIAAPPVVISPYSIQAQSSPQVTPSPEEKRSVDSEQSSIDYWDKVFGIFAKLFQIVAIGGGGFWAYYKFIKGRVYRPRLTLSLHANSLVISEQNLLLVSLTIENVGLSVVQLQKHSMLVRVLLPEVGKAGSKARKIKGNPIGTFRVFQHHALIESSEKIADELTLSIPSSQPEALIVQFRVVGWMKSLFRKRTLEWWSCEIVEPRIPGVIGSRQTQKGKMEPATETPERKQ
ncbi:MAG TPA: hypothetical protein VKC61_14665 [Pyrinomonadaceae bacterium]|nr:hypothetical protein [Pyrinomonadaceae bacterium]